MLLIEKVDEPIGWKNTKEKFRWRNDWKNLCTSRHTPTNFICPLLFSVSFFLWHITYIIFVFFWLLYFLLFFQEGMGLDPANVWNYEEEVESDADWKKEKRRLFDNFTMWAEGGHYFINIQSIISFFNSIIS